VWREQQRVLKLAFSDNSFSAIAKKNNDKPSHQTIRRWVKRLDLCFTDHTFHLCSHNAELGRHAAALASFWSACLGQMQLSDAMWFIASRGGSVP